MARFPVLTAGGKKVGMGEGERLGKASQGWLTSSFSSFPSGICIQVPSRGEKRISTGSLPTQDISLFSEIAGRTETAGVGGRTLGQQEVGHERALERGLPELEPVRDLPEEQLHHDEQLVHLG